MNEYQRVRYIFHFFFHGSDQPLWLCSNLKLVNNRCFTVAPGKIEISAMVMYGKTGKSNCMKGTCVSVHTAKISILLSWH